VKQGQEGTSAAVPSLAWLQSSDSCASTLAHSAYMSVQHGFVLLGTIHEYWKRDLGMLNRLRIDSDSLGRSEDQLIHQHVEAGAAMMDNLSGQDAEAWRHVFDINEAIRQIVRVRVCLSDEGVWVSFPENRDLPIETADCFIGPLYPFPAIIEGRLPSLGGHVAKTQTTKKGAEIPIPQRDDFFGVLKKAATPEKKSKNRRAAKKR
jgi:hypothetical protein